MTTLRILLFFSFIGSIFSTWSLSGYACNQPQLYQQCNCQSFCNSYIQQPCGGYNDCDNYGTNYRGYHPRRRHRIKHRKLRRKFRFDSDEEDFEIPPPPKSRKHRIEKVDEGFIEEKSIRTTTIQASAASDNSWEDEDLWEKKFVTESPKKLDEDEFPEISSSEIETHREEHIIPAKQTPRLPARTGQGIGVNTGLGVGAPGIGGLGGGGGLFGISSGVGVGVPGIGPIGVSSGLGIGK